MQVSSLLVATSYNEIGAMAAKNVGINRGRSLDIVCREVTVGGTNVLRVNNVSARTSLTSAAHRLDYQFLTDAIAMARAWNIPCGDDGMFTAVISPYVTPELAALPQWQAVESYRGEESGLYVGEVGMVHGIRFIESYNGKLFHSGGTTAQAATTLNGAVNAGATSIAYAANAGLAAGDFVTIGALDNSLAEQVQITAINASALTATIRGIGNAQGNFGLRYAHADGVAITEADQVGCIVLQGPNSIGKAYSDMTGPDGKLVISGPFDNLGRVLTFGWHAICGWAVVSQHFALRLEFGMRSKAIGANYY